MSSNVSKKMKGILPVLGILIILLMVAAIWYWESYGREKLFYQNVVVFKENQKRGAIVTNDMLTYASKPKSDIFKAAIVNKQQIIGYSVNHFIPAGATLHPSFFDNPNLVGDKNTLVFKIPSDWILSVPDSIRRGDKAIFYEANVSVFNSISGINTQSKANTLNTTSADMTEKVKAAAGNKITEAYVAYVKDSSNKEVLNQSNEDRYDGTGKPASIEILSIGDDQINKLKSEYESGHKFIILYSEDGEKN